MPYRASRVETSIRVAAPGIVDDMVRQFADRYAFLRELVQNAIDAGTTRVDVHLERDVTGAVTTSVADGGSGMTRAIIEGPLLTLFSSSKENDTSKIGKYGIGFVSVFAIDPESVEVRTRHGNETWLVRLFGDHTYELIPDERERTGTTVTLAHTMSSEDFATHAARVKHALERWCRHASVPIRVSVLDVADPTTATSTDVNEPLEVAMLVVVTSTRHDERVVVGVGPIGTDALPAENAPSSFCGFYNRGLTLYETTTAMPMLEGIHFKVDSPRLAHTISRDNVRRDGEFCRVMESVASLVKDGLARALQERLATAALSLATDTGAKEEYAALLRAASAPALAKTEKASMSDAIVVPLVDPVRRRGKTMTLRELCDASTGDVFVSDASSALTRCLARNGYPVVRHVSLMEALWSLVGRKKVACAELAVSFAGAVARTELHVVDGELEIALVALLKRAGRAARHARLATFLGVGSAEAFRVVHDAEDEVITPPRAHDARPWGRSSTLFCNVNDAAVRLARRYARSNVAIAAHLLCRTILLADGPLDAKVVDRLLEAASE